MEIKIIKDANNFEFKFQIFDFSEVKLLTFPKQRLTYTVAFFDSTKNLLAILIDDSLFKFVEAVRNSIDNLTKKGVQYFGFHYVSAAGAHFIDHSRLKDFETSFYINVMLMKALLIS